MNMFVSVGTVYSVDVYEREKEQWSWTDLGLVSYSDIWSMDIFVNLPAVGLGNTIKKYLKHM